MKCMELDRSGMLYGVWKLLGEVVAGVDDGMWSSDFV